MSLLMYAEEHGVDGDKAPCVATARGNSCDVGDASVDVVGASAAHGASGIENTGVAVHDERKVGEGGGFGAPLHCAVAHLAAGKSKEMLVGVEEGEERGDNEGQDRGNAGRVEEGEVVRERARAKGVSYSSSSSSSACSSFDSSSSLGLSLDAGLHSPRYSLEYSPPKAPPPPPPSPSLNVSRQASLSLVRYMFYNYYLMCYYTPINPPLPGMQVELLMITPPHSLPLPPPVTIRSRLHQPVQHGQNPWARLSR